MSGCVPWTSLRKLAVSALRKCFDAVVGGPEHRERHASEHRRHVDHLPASARLEVRQHLLHTVERRLHVDPHHLVEVIVGQFRRHAGDPLPDVVHPHVNVAEAFDRLLESAAHVGTDRHVGDDRQRVCSAARCHLVQRVGPTGNQCERCPVAREPLCQSRPYPGAGAGNHDDEFRHPRILRDGPQGSARRSRATRASRAEGERRRRTLPNRRGGVPGRPARPRDRRRRSRGPGRSENRSCCGASR